MPLLSMLGRVFAISTLVLGLVSLSQWYTINKYKDELLIALTGKAIQDANVQALESQIEKTNLKISKIQIEYDTRLNEYKIASKKAIEESVQKYRDQASKSENRKDTYGKDCNNTHDAINAIRVIGL